MKLISLANKYRPTVFEDVVGQDSTKAILSAQIKTDTIKHAYLFCGAAGTGKTTSARIFASMINHGQGIPIELDAASNNGVDDIRDICEQAKSKSLDSEYKVFILDEVHVLSNQAWQAMLKTLEEPPAKSVFILCTTNPEKIPATILSRVQRYNFQRITYDTIVKRLDEVARYEKASDAVIATEALVYIARLSNGQMRDALAMLDKCFSYSKDITLQNVISALGVVDYAEMFRLTDLILNKDVTGVWDFIDTVFNSGRDLKQFLQSYFEFMLDLVKYAHTNRTDLVKIPATYLSELKWSISADYLPLLKLLMEMNSDIKWMKEAKEYLDAKFALFIVERT